MPHFLTQVYLCASLSLTKLTKHLRKWITLLLVLSFLWICVDFLNRILATQKFGPVPLPPGPRPFPIIGNILQLGKQPHQALANLSKDYGHIMILKLGSLTTIVLSSPEMAKEALHKHDPALCSRTIRDSLRSLDHHKISMVFLPVSAPWRNLRKVCAIQIFSAQRLDATHAMRRIKVKELLDYVQENCNRSSAIDIGQAAFTTVLNSISNTLFSIDLADHQSDLSQSFKELACCITEEAGNPNVADYFPVLQFVDPQGSRKRMTSYFVQILRIFDGIINERLQARSSSGKSNKEINDVLDSLLNLTEENNSELSLIKIKHLLLDLLLAGIDTTSSTIEWTMAELLHNPGKLAKAQNELRGLLGKNGMDLTMKETLRLHPPVPFLVPRKAETEVYISGFRVPKNAQILVNIWAMGRNSNIWTNPNSFMPERFLDRKTDIKGRDFELIPFGSGRRICPGLPLADRMLHSILTSLVFTFDWKLAEGLKPDEADMSEKFGFTLHKAEPLLAIPMKRCLF